MGCTFGKDHVALLRTGKKKKSLGILLLLLGHSFCLEWVCLYLPKNVGVCVSSLFSGTGYPQPGVERAHVVIALRLLLTGILDRANAEIMVDDPECLYLI